MLVIMVVCGFDLCLCDFLVWCLGCFSWFDCCFDCVVVVVAVV